MCRLLLLLCLLLSTSPTVLAEESLEVTQEASRETSRETSCCAENRSLLKAEVADDSPVLSFFIWRRQFARPVFCSVILCNSSCRDFEDGCFLDGFKVLPTKKGGCCQSPDTSPDKKELSLARDRN
ncbi:MAG: hypothetical protein J0M35_06955 [Candidatus Obscuribacter phosphatis]|uniref:Secreted protein n=1 Tax=Candidatus Obscuribacter phosphatis TaxID=1906157 RepID=A0A8J7PC12_9BACT|nr:hypothetical protein [Candidatus Obscuribacter phosphatis]